MTKIIQRARSLVVSIALAASLAEEQRQTIEPLRARVNRPGQTVGETMRWPTLTGRWERLGRRYEARATSDGVMVDDLDAQLWRYESDKRWHGGWRLVIDTEIKKGN